MGKIGGNIPYCSYDTNPNMILDIPDEYFLNLPEDITFDELVAEIGEPSGSFGFGLVYDFWRIGEKKYAVAFFGADKIKFEIYIDES